MRRLAALALLPLAGCGGGSGNDGGATENQIEQLSTPEVEIVDPQAPVRPQSLKIADLAGARMPVPDCAFGRDGRMLLAATSGDAIARVNNELRHFTQSAPMGPSGGFFEDRQLSISVGRVGETSADSGRWPARIMITNRRAQAQIELVGVWRCEPVAREP